MALSTVIFADPFFADMDRIINHLYNSKKSAPITSQACSAPVGGSGHPAIAMDIIEAPTAYELYADAPGMSPEDIKVDLHEGVLTVSGERKLAHTSSAPGTKAAGEADTSSGASGSGAGISPVTKVWRSERAPYSFSRSFTLPDNANLDKISATMDKGVLRVTVAKREPPARAEPRRIAVTAATTTTTANTGA